MLLGTSAPVVVALLAATELGAPPRSATIVGGEEDAQDDFSQVVGVQAHEQRCSAVAVSSNVVVTAAHCLDQVEFGQAVYVSPGVSASFEDRRQGIEWGVHPEYCPDCTTQFFDFGYIRLFQPLDESTDWAIPPSSRSQWNGVVARGEPVTLVGYGTQSESEDVDGDRRKRFVEVDVRRVLRGQVEFETVGNGKGICDGDSGGAAFVRNGDGELVWVGVNARSDGCGQRAVVGASHAALCWLRDETDVDFLAPGCESCDCVGPPAGCACHSDTGGTNLGFLIVGVVVVLRRRARAA